MTDYREKACWSVYIHIVPKIITGHDHDKYYVGITSKNVSERWGHNGYGYHSQLFYRPIQKYGWENIQHEIIAENITEQEAYDIEDKLITMLNARNSKFGYNIARGGGKILDRTQQHILEDRHNIKIYKFDINGLFMNCYESIVQASECENIPLNRMDNILKMHYIYNEIIYAREDFVSFYKDIPILSPFYNPRKSIWQIRVHQFDLKGKYITTYESINEAVKHTGIKDNVIRGIIYHNNTRIGNSQYLWATDKDVLKTETGYTLTYLDWFTIFQFSISGSFIDYYVSCKNASEITGIPYDIIHGQLRAKSTKRIKAGQRYIWRRVEDVEFTGSTFTIKELKNVSKILGIEVFQFDKDGNYIAKYKNAKIASETVNDLSHSALLRQVKNPSKNSRSKFYWRTINDVEEQPDGTYKMTG